MISRTLIYSPLFVLLTLGLAACGGDGSGGFSTVPNVVGNSQAAASTAITSAGLTVGTVTTQASSTVASGDVILEDPGAGATVGSGSAVALFVSSGPATPVVVSGTVASGTALTGTVAVFDSSGNAQPRSTGNAIGTGGQYTLTVTGFTAPFLIQATGQVGGQGPTVTLYAVATAGGTVNITPITTLIALNLAAGNLQSLETGSAGNLPTLTAADVSDQNTNVDTLLASVLAAEGLSATYNLSATPFTVGSAGYDRLLDTVSVNSTTATAVTVTNITAPTSPITIDTAKGTPSGVLDITSGPTTLPSGTIGYLSVPNVVGDTQSAAGTAITGAGLTVGTVTQAASATVASGDVISEIPAAASSVAKGSAVALVVSSGPALVTVPNVVGESQATAATALTGVGLTIGAVTQAASATVASGDVITETPAAGASATSGSTVALVVSTGPQTYTIGGTVIGLKSSGTVHVQNGNDNDAITANGAFTLSTPVISGTAFTLSLGALPTGQVCAVQNGSGTVTGANVTNVLVYCTYTQSVATLDGTYAGAGYNINNDADGEGSGVPFDGAGNAGNAATGIVNVGGTITTNPGSFYQAGPYTVVTTNAIPVLTTGGNNIGAIAGADADEFFWLADASTVDGGGLPALAVWVNPLQNGTIAQLAGNWFVAGLDSGSNPDGYGGVLTINADGSFSGALTSLDETGVVATNAQSGPAGTFTVTIGGQFSNGSNQLGYFSANGEFLVAANATNGSKPGFTVAVKQGTGVTLATLNGVYTVGSLAFSTATTGDGQVNTLFFDGAGNFHGTGIDNDNGVITTGNTASGTYSVTSTGELTVTLANGNVRTGAVSADGNIIVAANLMPNGAEVPRLTVGFRQ